MYVARSLVLASIVRPPADAARHAVFAGCMVFLGLGVGPRSLGTRSVEWSALSLAGDDPGIAFLEPSFSASFVGVLGGCGRCLFLSSGSYDPSPGKLGVVMGLVAVCDAIGSLQVP